MAILTIARLTFREASRRRLLLTVAILTVVMVVATTWGFSRLDTLTCGRDRQACPPEEIKLVTAQLLILVAYMFNVVLALGAVFVSATAISGEVDSGIALAMLPRPIRRSDLVLGKWLALVVLVSAYAAVTAALEFIGVDLVAGYLPPHPVIAVFFLAGQSVILLTLALLGSTRLAPMTTGVIAVVLFGLAWLGGIAEAIGLAFNNATIAAVGTAMGLIVPTDGLWRGVIFNLEPVAVVTLSTSSRGFAANPFNVGAPPPPAYIIWAVAWVAVILGLTMWSFAKRDL
ncbi:MAG TPA: ABC transporter permease [Chloroflexota bacterium]|nr:ABC transporter permease [Chloroflexota bacterium]